MENQTKPNSFKKLLDRLQEDSWQLELLVSGFAIFGLFSVIEPLQEVLIRAWGEKNLIAHKIYQVTYLAVLILIFNLILHLVFRSLWIGALGLRYVSGDIEVEKLNYTPKFRNYLKRRTGSFDDYIKKLEEFSSVIFAISFLLIFYVASFFITISITSFLAASFLGSGNTFVKWTGIIVLFIFSTGAILTFFDFITLGLLKKHKWTTKIYFPFYIFFSFITLSFLYRPLSYNLLDNKFGRRISILLVPAYILILVVSTLYNEKSNYVGIESTNTSNSMISSSRNYEDLVEEGNSYIDDIAIQSKVITEPFLKLIIPLWKGADDRVFNFNQSLKPKKDSRGYKTPIKITLTSPQNNPLLKQKQDSLQNEYLKTFNKIYSIKIDSTTYQSDFIITNRNNKKLGFESYIGIQNLSEGKHILSFQRLKHPKTDSIVTIKKIPFWYFKN